jgi:hypothetical protein
MTAPLSASRVEELREQIRTGAVVIWSPDISGVADIINIVERYSSMRAENERLKQLPVGGDARGILTMARNEVDGWCKEAVHQRNRAEKAEAQLARQAPLVEAASEYASTEFSTSKDIAKNSGVSEYLLRTAVEYRRAALALRESKEKK